MKTLMDGFAYGIAAWIAISLTLAAWMFVSYRVDPSKCSALSESHSAGVPLALDDFRNAITGCHR